MSKINYTVAIYKPHPPKSTKFTYTSNYLLNNICRVSRK